MLCVTGRAWEGIAACERALAIDQNLAAAHGAIGAFKAHVGRRRGDRGACQGSPPAQSP
jgi:hypothetical protein